MQLLKRGKASSRFYAANGFFDMTQEQMITVRLPYPISANLYWRTRVIKGVAMTYVSAAAKAYKIESGLRARLAGLRSPITGPVHLSFTLHPKLTKKGAASLVCLDLSNCIKVSEDALNGVAYVDDKQVVRILAEIGSPVMNGGLTVSVGPA